MNTRSNAARRLDAEISNVGDPPCGDQVPPLDEDMNDDQALVDPRLTDGSIRANLFQMSQAITTQS